MLPPSLTGRSQHLQARLEVLAADLEAMWATALSGGDFATIDRLAEAGHALQRAIVALQDDGLVPARPAPCTVLDLGSAPDLQPTNVMRS